MGKSHRCKALNVETKGIGVIVGGGEPSWEKGVAGMLAMRRRVWEHVYGYFLARLPLKGRLE